MIRDYLYNKRFFSMGVILLWLAISRTVGAQTAEKSINLPSIYEKMLDTPQPQGRVDENSPWLHFRIPIPKVGKKEPSELAHRLYFFELSQDSTFKKNVIRSKPKRWSFYNPYRILEKGRWYWRYAYTLDSAPEKRCWSDKIYSFTITGDERQVVYPTPEQLTEKVTKTKGPHVVMLREDIGKLMPENRPDIKKRLMADFEKLLADTTPVKVVVDTTVYPKHLTKAGIHRHFTLKTLKQFTNLADRVRMLLNAYLLTGDERYKKKGLESFYDLDREYHTTMMRYSKRPGFPDDFTVEQHTKTMNLILDAFADDLSDEWRNKIVDLLYTIKKDGYLNFYKQLEFSEHAVYKAHLWQMCVYTLLSSSIILSPYKEDAKLWMEYAYELWLYRNPAGSRNDGGWHAGNGYFGANERQLAFTPLFLSKLMKYNYFSHPWYQNVSKYLTYSTPYGNPGLAFGDGRGYGGSNQPYLSEILAHIYPDNYWNLWRMKSREDNGQLDKRLKLAQESVWGLLEVWGDYKTPPYKSVKAPEEAAALFPDIGYVGMHTDFEHPEKNMFVNFRSCLFGQLNHAHPAQNAFNIAYGDEPLFWRTGHYAVAAEHGSQDFKHSRAHNTILADGIGQICDVSGYGWIPRFVTGKNIAYALGDASHAYTKGKDAPASYTEPGVTRFRRHIVRLRPYYVLIYDELEANHPINWTFRLNAWDNMTEKSENVISTRNASAQATAYLFCNGKISSEVTDKFIAAPIDVQGKLKNGKDRHPNQWHCSVTTDEKMSKARFFAVVEVTPDGERQLYRGKMSRDKEGYSCVDIDNYRIRVQLDSEKPSFMEIVNEKEECALVTGQGAESVILNNKIYKVKEKGATLFVEKDEKGKLVRTQQTDVLPDAVIYGNQY